MLYGTTSAGGTAGAGTVFSLAPPARVKGHYKETVLYSFTGADDGAYPRGGVALDAAGNVYTVAQYGGNAAFGNGAGTVIKLAPPAQAGAAWTETTLHTFDGLAGGGQPGSTPVVGADGTVYGTTDLGGNTTVCQNFGEPAGCGTVFALHPPASGTKWGFKVLHAFQISDGEVPWSGLFQDSTGLYGTTELWIRLQRRGVQA
ncbi:MAG: choice-of-anchor tandem repeat GloVer-containing protein [Rhodospirillales bacterium]